MKEYIHIQDRQNKSLTIFTKHIAYIDDDGKGAVIHLFCSGAHIQVLTTWTIENLLKELKQHTSH